MSRIVTGDTARENTKPFAGAVWARPYSRNT